MHSKMSLSNSADWGLPGFFLLCPPCCCQVASVLSVLPYSTVELVVPGPSAEWRKTHKTRLALLDRHYMRHSAFVSEGSASGVDLTSPACAASRVLALNPHPVSTGRMVVFASLGQVVTAADLVARPLPPSVTPMEGEALQAVAPDGSVFLVAQRRYVCCLQFMVLPAWQRKLSARGARCCCLGGRTCRA